ncbi:hypothetical protein HK104_000794 [Borealophlyctis nickersoniae]|nr:hypothetical protein HK104_000794 [Borealophlyctis nickersoniae]
MSNYELPAQQQSRSSSYEHPPPTGSGYQQELPKHASVPRYQLPTGSTFRNPSHRPEIPRGVQVDVYPPNHEYWKTGLGAPSYAHLPLSTPASFLSSSTTARQMDEYDSYHEDFGPSSTPEQDLRELLQNITVDSDITDEDVAQHQPAQLLVQLLPHQIEGMLFFCYVATSLQAISSNLRRIRCEVDEADGRFAKQRRNPCRWETEINSKAKPGCFKVLVYHGPKRTKKPEDLCRYDVVITSYNVVSSEYPKEKKAKKGGADGGEDDSAKKPKVPAVKGPLFKVKWFRVVLDEAQYIKNKATRSAQGCYALSAKKRWCLTGTPLQNSVDELYSLLRFLRIKPYEEWSTFKEHIINDFNRGRRKRAVKRLQIILAAIMKRRTKQTKINGKPLFNLPARTVELIKIPFNPSAAAFYQQLEEKLKEKLEKLTKDGNVTKNYANIFTMLLRLRQACLHPHLVGDTGAAEDQLPEMDEDVDEMTALFESMGVAKEQACTVCLEKISDAKPDQTVCSDCQAKFVKTEATVKGAKKRGKNSALIEELRRKWVPSAKTEKMMEILADIRQKDPDGKTIIFCQFTTMLDIMEIPLERAGYKFCRYDGSMDGKAREASLHRFRTEPDTKVILISFKCGSLGLNLTVANRVIMMDVWWNPALEEQAIDRVHRIGQTRDVEVVRLTVEDTVEDRILQLQEKKRELIDGALDGTNLKRGGKNAKLSIQDLLYLFHSEE